MSKRNVVKKKSIRNYSIVPRLLGGVVLTGCLGLAAINLPALSANASEYSKAQAAKDVQLIVDRFTITEFCGQDSWSVRKGYEISRKRFLESNLVTMKQFRHMRLRAIKKAEAYLEASGPSDFNRWCSKNSEAATQFFLGLMSGNKTSFDTTYKP